MTSEAPKRLTRDEAAAYIRSKHNQRCTSGYLAKLACIGGGPTFRRLDGRWAEYLEADLDAWAASRVGPALRKASDQPLREQAAA